MRVEIKKFGEILISRPAGREAFLAFRAYSPPANNTEPIDLDFSGVKVMGPSWIDEFLIHMKRGFSNPIHCLPSDNPSVKESLKILE